jgi:hypothetical protein
MRRPGLLVFGFLALSASIAPAMAQSGRAQDSMRFRVGWFAPTGTSEFWTANEATFSMDHSDFDDWMFGASYVTSVGNHFEFGFNADYYDSTVRSEYRDFVDQNNNPILHDSTLKLLPLTIDLRLLPGGRYKETGEYGNRNVRKPVVWLGVGGGGNLWHYEEVGDFVGGVVPTVIFDRVVDDGFVPEVHAMAGFELPAGPNFAWTVEARYSWSEAELGGRFDDIYGPNTKVDLSGGSLFAGLSYQF